MMLYNVVSEMIKSICKAMLEFIYAKIEPPKRHMVTYGKFN